MYAESIRSGAIMRYSSAVESQETNEKFANLETQFDLWLSEQQ